eukprot:CAMPEP_0195520376 /NCGR_PEP_ID=MMETSP0794_2-20130614/16732_1 /TAXON_ID=515487 /ORGANISM="Stephanopyxis turris, Strain CCMP 815" /LENGTH=144 /DNA_ID=CAMNT_0040649717 /DNA_START=27 /DNA_END=461 /DNA_ORIENTATION=+
MTLAFALAGRALSAFAFVASTGRKLPSSTHLSHIRTQITRSYSSTTTLGATQFVLHYDYIPEVLEKRGPYREGHIGLLKELAAEGKCLLGGPSGPVGMEVPTGALFVFTDEESAKIFVKDDPYVEAGIVTGHSITEWNVVIEKE